VVPAGSAPRVRQVASVVGRAHKMATLGRVLDAFNPTSAIVFCGTRTEVDELTESLNGRGYRAEALHGGLSQEQLTRRHFSQTSKAQQLGSPDTLCAAQDASRAKRRLVACSASLSFFRHRAERRMSAHASKSDGSNSTDRC